jgi:glycerol-3-phosphate O-acyltransferase / dihydroxyacetone phosphate acyltransferase
MWLLPALSVISRILSGVFYRLTLAGDSVPPRGPALLVGNHTNSLLDPALLAAAARRPVRFLAKAPLFEMPQLGWLMRAAGCIPVYRRQDDPTLVSRNAEAFRAVEEALLAGSAVGLFPEGISHDEPSLAPLKTGAARIALGTANRLGRSFPIVPIGLVFRDKAIFRSEALAVVGAPVAWDDLVGASPDDTDTVLELTRRIEQALRKNTLNLEQWEDRPVLECAEAIYAAEFDSDTGDPDHARRLERLQVAADVLARLRRERDARWRALAEEVERHHRRLRWLGLRPSDLNGTPGAGAVVRWGLRTLPAASLPAVIVAAIGSVIFWVPYRLTGVIATRASPGPDTDATYKALYGTVVFASWTILLSGAAAVVGGWLAGLGALVALPLLGAATLAVIERWRASGEDVRRFFTLRRRRARIAELRSHQRALAARLDAILRDAGVAPPSPRPTV